ncbi:GAF domain-containing protein [Azohydromonas aeria]|uniref:GAF domain-containing protein n=1 Tax=Azohydromonas aeria TaxID=2590212 RepID=UPI0012F85DDE|nr:GAF domain-containing protein [Azohydromonas aeria]
MQQPPVPPNEQARLEALRRLGMLDTLADPSLDELVHYAARELDVPIALVSLVDTERQWFKARVGLEHTELPRDVSFCGHAICGDDVFVVEDALQDERFAANPLVIGELNMRFYAGVPLKSPDGQRVGTLCVIDTRPRTLDTRQRDLLQALGAVAAWELARKHWMPPAEKVSEE